MMDRQTCLIGWTDEHALFEELKDIPDLILTLLFPSNTHQSGTSVRLLFTFGLIVMIMTMMKVMMTIMVVTTMIMTLTHNS